MPFVQIHADLNKIKSKVAFNLTKRQLICFGSAAAVGVPTYIFTRGAIGNDGAVLLMIGLMLPFFFMAMYERDNQPAEKILINFIRTRFFFPRRRLYQTENLYKILSEGADVIDKETGTHNKKSNKNNK